MIASSKKKDVRFYVDAIVRGTNNCILYFVLHCIVLYCVVKCFWYPKRTTFFLQQPITILEEKNKFFRFIYANGWFSICHSDEIFAKENFSMNQIHNSKFVVCFYFRAVKIDFEWWVETIFVRKTCIFFVGESESKTVNLEESARLSLLRRSLKKLLESKRHSQLLSPFLWKKKQNCFVAPMLKVNLLSIFSAIIYLPTKHRMSIFHANLFGCLALLLRAQTQK